MDRDHEGFVIDKGGILGFQRKTKVEGIKTMWGDTALNE